KDDTLGRRATSFGDKAEAPNVAETISPNGSPLERWLYESGVRSYLAVPLLNDAKSVVGYLALSHDMPGAPSKAFMPLLTALARVLAPALIRARAIERGRLFGALVGASSDGMIALDAKGRIIEANDAALRLLARRREGTVGQRIADVLGRQA